MDVIAYPDPRLKAKAALAEGVSPELLAIGERLLATAKAARAYGLAASHLGEVAPVVVISADGAGHRLLYNPEIVATGGEVTAAEEGSVSLPGAQVAVERPDWADVRFMSATGEVTTERFEGFLGRVAQHEIDQMNGVFFLDRVSRLKRDMAIKKARKSTG